MALSARDQLGLGFLLGGDDQFGRDVARAAHIFSQRGLDPRLDQEA
jgi:hypothetical protein